MKFEKYLRVQEAILRPVTENDITSFEKSEGLTKKLIVKVGGETPTEVSISQPDKEYGSPKIGDMIAINPDNHMDQWLVAEDYFKKNFEEKFKFKEVSNQNYNAVANKTLRKDLDKSLQNLKSLGGSRERSLAITKLQEAIMWLGMDLKRIGEENPYPNSYNPDNTIIDKTSDNLKL